MRYRPFGATYGMAVSTVSLLLDDRPLASARHWYDILTAAMSAGINTFELTGHGEALIDGLKQALATVERRLVFIAWRPPGQGDLEQAVEAMLQRIGLQYFDLLVLTEGVQVAPARQLKQGRMIRQVGLAAVDDLADKAVASEGVDCLVTPYSLMSGWRDRHRLKLASQRNLAVIAHDAFPRSLSDTAGPSLIPKGWFRKKPKVSHQSAYHFLEGNPGWTGEEICIAFALFEPAVTTVRIEADSVERINRLAAVPERELPTGVTAQIEMARFSGEQRS
ncbi:MAG: hypothetical protein GC145_03405 [Caulobacter sp.]|nr:hypothetical protein [Caulobacter sp.]